MQMFNGFVMRLLRVYWVNLNTEIADGWNEWIEDNPLKGIESILNDNSISQEEKGTLNDTMNESFFSQLDSYLNNNGVVSEAIKDSLVSILNNYESRDEDIYNKLKQLADKLWIKEVNWTWTKETQQQVVSVEGNAKPSKPFEWELSWITPLEKKDDKQPTPQWKLYKWLTREDSTSQGEKLYDTIQDIGNQINRVEALLSDNNLSSNTDLKEIKQLLENIKAVIDNTTPENVSILQKYISDNLPDLDKADFDKASKKGDKFDGKFWTGTLKWLNLLLKKTSEYISSFEKSWDQLDSKDVFKDVNLKSEVDLSSLDWNVGAENFFNSLPEWISATFKDSKGVNVNNTEDQEVVVVLEKDGNTKEITLVVKREDSKLTIEEKSSDSSQNDVEGDNLDTKSQPTSSTPLDLNDQKFQVMQNSSALASSTGLTWVTFYSTTPFSWENPTDGQWGFTEATTNNNKNGDYEYYVKFGDNSEPYKIKVDGNWNLCPIMDNPSNNEVGTLLMRNTSCINYLKNKAGNLGWDCRIWWSEEKHDYCIDSYWRSLTIEPMTIDWKWVSGKLWENLALLNFTNFLRSGGDINGVKLKGPDPDLKIDDEGNLKVRVEKSKESGGKKWLDVPLEWFWLTNIDQNVLNKFVKYNNHEDWMDDWDRKKPNKYYKKVDAEGLWVKITDNSATPPQWEPTTPPQWESKPDNAVVDGSSDDQVTTHDQNVDENENAIDSEWTQNFEWTIDPSLIWSRMDGARVDAINKVAWQNILNFSGNDGAKTLKYNMANIKWFLEDKVSKDFKTYCTKKPSSERYAWISAVQIVLNNINGDDNKLVVDGERWPKTRNKVVEFQKANEKITVDWVPGPTTIKAMLDKAGSSTVTDVVSDNGDAGQVDTSWIANASALWLSEYDASTEIESLLIPEWITKFYKKSGDEGGDNWIYYKDWNNIVRVSVDDPWLKRNTVIPADQGNIEQDISKWTSTVAVFEGWRSKIESRFKTQQLEGLVWRDAFEKLSITISEADSKKYQLKIGDNVIFLDDDVLSKDFCGKKEIEDKLKILYWVNDNKESWDKLVTLQSIPSDNSQIWFEGWWTISLNWEKAAKYWINNENRKLVVNYINKLKGSS